MQGKKINTTLLIIIIIELIACFLVYAYIHNRAPKEVQQSTQRTVQTTNTTQATTATTTNTPSATQTTSTTPAAPVNPDAVLLEKAKSFTLGNLKFLYPNNLSMAKGISGGVIISHRVPYSHIDTCNANGQAQQQTGVTDVNLSFKVVASAIADAMAGSAPSDITAYQTGTLSGYQVFSGSSGCSSYTYYFPITSKQTLVVNRVLPSQLNPINPNYSTVSQLPGIISAAKEEAIFTAILNSKK